MSASTKVAASVDLGINVLLGGGFRVVERLEGKRSATVLLRGGPGAGKTLMALEVAVTLARHMGGDVVVGCMELLPSEFAAQVEGARSDLRPSVVVLPMDSKPKTDGPHIYCGLLTDGPDGFDPVLAMEALAAVVTEKRGGNPTVFVLDSLIEGYGASPSMPRVDVDAVIKLAVDRGAGLVLCEETTSETPSAWSFAADTVLELSVDAQRGRQIEVRKHRFGPSASGRHGLAFFSGTPPVVSPSATAWRSFDAEDVLGRCGLSRWSVGTFLSVVWREQAGPKGTLQGPFIIVEAKSEQQAQQFAFALEDLNSKGNRRLAMVLDPMVKPGFALRERGSVPSIPTADGPEAALRMLMEQWLISLTRNQDVNGPRLLVVGDVAPVLLGPDGIRWAECLQTFASVVFNSPWACPVVMYAGRATDSDAAGMRMLRRAADLTTSPGPDALNPSAQANEDAAQVARRQRRWI
jgi:KaiC/GvpD/RAD55 family RecA-like ATPase